MKRRDALAAVPAALYAAACDAGQDKPGATPGASYPKGNPPKPAAGVVPITSRVAIRFREGQPDVQPQVAVLKAGSRSSLIWDIQIPADHTLEINFVASYEGDLQLLGAKASSARPKRGPFRAAQNDVRGRYTIRGAGSLNSGPSDVEVASYWKYEITITGPDRTVVSLIDPGVIFAETG
jgi:hypothetical protein